MNSDATSPTRAVSGYASRRGPIDAQIKAARAEETPEGRKQAQELAQPVDPAAAVRCAAAGRQRRRRWPRSPSLLPYYDVYPRAVRILRPGAMGPARQRRRRQLGGAWYAAPDPAARTAFEQAYTAEIRQRRRRRWPTSLSTPAAIALALDARRASRSRR